MHPLPARSPPSLISLAVLALLAGSAARAQTPAGDYPYLGVGLGQARAHLDAQRLGSEALAGTGLSVTDTSRDASDSAYKLFGGYQFNPFLGLEASYVRLGHFSYRAATSPAGQIDGRLKVHAMALDLVGNLPLSERLSGLVRAGYQRARTNADWAGSGAAALDSGSARSNYSAPRYGVGLQYAFTPQYFMRAEAERSRFADVRGGTVRASVYSVSLVMPFGTAAPPIRQSSYVPPERPRVMAEPAPAPVAYVAPPPPVVVAAPAPAPAPLPLRKVSFKAESLFGFDSAELRAPGKTALDSFAGELAGTQYDRIAVTGHTDRLGSTAYNQTLSVRRADAVKAYLVASTGIDAARISAEGRSESEPVTQPGDCKGAKSARVIACLQPDRRVDIEVSGTR
jgi:OOP family OmpA-OmpF porin